MCWGYDKGGFLFALSRSAVEIQLKTLCTLSVTSEIKFKTELCFGQSSSARLHHSHANYFQTTNEGVSFLAPNIFSELQFPFTKIYGGRPFGKFLFFFSTYNMFK